jgi:hypothetical protein
LSFSHLNSTPRGARMQSILLLRTMLVWRRATAGAMKHIFLTKSKSPSPESVKALGRWANIDSITPLDAYVTKANLLIFVSCLLILVSFLPYMC